MIKALAVAFVISATLAVTSAQEPVSIGVLREDGYLVPIATIVGGRYQALLVPSTIKENMNVFSDRARRLSGLTWTVSLLNGTQVSARTLNRAMVENHCSFEEAWRSSFKGIKVDPQNADIKKLGIAVRGAVAEQPEDVTTPRDEPSRHAASLALELAAAMERDRLKTDPALLKDYILPKDGLPAIEITKLFRHSTGDVATYFFETSRGAYPLMTTGWIVDSPGGRVAHNVTFSMNDDTYKNGQTGKVIGLVRLPMETLWLLEWHGYAWEHLAIHGWPSGRIHFEAAGAGC